MLLPWQRGADVVDVQCSTPLQHCRAQCGGETLCRPDGGSFQEGPGGWSALRLVPFVVTKSTVNVSVHSALAHALETPGEI